MYIFILNLTLYDKFKLYVINIRNFKHWPRHKGTCSISRMQTLNPSVVLCTMQCQCGVKVRKICGPKSYGL